MLEASLLLLLLFRLSASRKSAQIHAAADGPSTHTLWFNVPDGGAYEMIIRRPRGRTAMWCANFPSPRPAALPRCRCAVPREPRFALV